MTVRKQEQLETELRAGLPATLVHRYTETSDVTRAVDSIQTRVSISSCSTEKMSNTKMSNFLTFFSFFLLLRKKC